MNIYALDFLKKARDLYGDAYEYNIDTYVNSKTKMEIICPKHGSFWMTPSHHIQGQKCPRCKGLYKTTEEFIKEAREAHGDKYDYSKTEYNGSHNKVCIICPKHGEFWQMAKDHLRGQGCSKCGADEMWKKRGRVTTEDFIEKAMKVHGDKYDYSKVNYKKSNIKVCIICPEHGEFMITPNNHLNGHGCPKCKGWGKTTEDLIKEFKSVHGDAYDYSKVEYKTMKTKVCIICPKHGEFWQLPYVHLKGQGCDKCGDEKISQKLSLTKEEFIEKAKAVHGDKYDYSKVEYKNNQSKVCIICPEHGEFWQIPNNHIRGEMCPKCASHRSYAYTLDEFIEKAREVHGDKYDYSKAEYVNGDTPIKIICPIHGEFAQKPSLHLQGCGCKKCHDNRMEREWRLTLEKHNIEYIQEYSNGFGMMKLDFFLPEYNVAIECQGMQHFEPVRFGGDNDIVEAFKSCVERDQKKKMLCEEKGIKLFYFTNLKYKIKEFDLKNDFGGIYDGNIYTFKKEIIDKIKGMSKIIKSNPQ